MLRTLIFFVLALTSLAPDTLAAGENSIAGPWRGTLDVGNGIKLRIVFHFKVSSKGILGGTMDSVDQGATGIPLSKVTLKKNTLHVESAAVQGTYDATLSANGRKFTGTWKQGPAKLALNLEPGTFAEKKRSQEPIPPFPYVSENVTFSNPGAKITLAGTLTMPRKGGPFPAVLLISGSGPQDRDESLAGHRPFAVLADHLTRKGIAVLRVDDRGVGKSTGSFAVATTTDFMLDAQAALKFLRSRKGIDARRTGLLGHSEGAIVAALLAAKDRNVAYTVLLAGPGVKGEQLILRQTVLLQRSMGVPEKDIARGQAQARRIYSILRSKKDTATVRKELTRLAAEMKDGSEREALTRQFGTLTSPWFRQFLVLDPAVALQKVKCPVLAVTGARDLQVDPDQNLPAIKAALKAGGNTDYTVRKLPGLNHLLQAARTGTIDEYARIEETVNPAALNAVSGWILSRTRR